MARRTIDFSDLESIVLVALENFYFEDQKYFIRLHELSGLSSGAPVNALRDAVQTLIYAGFAEQQTVTKFRPGTVFSNDAGTYQELADGYKISKKGLLEVGKYSDEKHSAISARIGAKRAAPPRSDDPWTPMPIDRESPLYTEALRASEEALKEIESSNGFSATEPEVRDGIVATMRGTLSAIRAGFPSRAAIISGLLKPLQYVSKKFGDASVGGLATIAVQTIIKWLGLG